MYKVFDIHTHTYPEAISDRACIALGNFYNFEVKGKGTYAHLESQAKENNVCGYLLFSVATNATQVEKVNSSSASLAELSRSRGFKTVGYAGMQRAEGGAPRFRVFDQQPFSGGNAAIACGDFGGCG